MVLVALEIVAMKNIELESDRFLLSASTSTENNLSFLVEEGIYIASQPSCSSELG
jgi:hypothetical protein